MTEPKVNDNPEIAAILSQDPPAQEPEPPKTEAQTIEIDGKQYTQEQAKELISKGEGFTQKTMTLAEERKAFEAQRVQQEAIASHARTILETLANPATREQALREIDAYNGGQQVAPSIQLADPTDNERVLLEIVTDLKRQLQSVAPVLGEVQSFVGQQKASTEMQAKAIQAAQEFEAGGIKVSPDELLAAAKSAGSSDPKSAWASANWQRLLQHGASQAQEGERPPGPAPQGGKSFDPMDKRLSADDMNRLRSNGFVPIER